MEITRILENLLLFTVHAVSTIIVASIMFGIESYDNMSTPLYLIPVGISLIINVGIVISNIVVLLELFSREEITRRHELLNKKFNFTFMGINFVFLLLFFWLN